MGSLYKYVYKQAALTKAWQKVRSNGLSSSSEDTRTKIHKFDEDSLYQLTLIQRQLSEKRFHFAPQKGLPIEKKKGSGKYRPVVLAPIRNRIVQRVLLNVLQADVPAIKKVLETPTSIGGIPKRGTRHAIKLIVDAMEDGARWFVSSDISGFFTKIPKKHVVNFIKSEIKDATFLDLFARAMDTTLENEKELGAHRDLFPIDDEGVAQGSPLSPLMGNILLHKFDEVLNGRGMTCVRYIDDFIILGPSRMAVMKTMKTATAMLDAFSMEVYDPKERPDKAGFGQVSDGFDFLGCHINPGQVAPSKDARGRLIEKVNAIILTGKKAVHATANNDKPTEHLQCQIQTLIKINGVLKGWGHAFSFCKAPDVMNTLDAKVDAMTYEFMQLCHNLGVGKSTQQRRRILGISLLTDIPPLSLHEDTDLLTS